MPLANALRGIGGALLLVLAVPSAAQVVDLGAFVGDRRQPGTGL